MTNDTLYLIVTCNLESTRMDAFRQVVENLKSMPDQSFLDNMVLFDNASTLPESDELVKSYFKTVVKAERNVGFWSAIHWTLHNHEALFGRTFQNFYVIESDMIHTQDAFQRLADCERFLASHENIGFIRTEEFSVENRHLYDKRQHHKNSVRYAWVVQDNYIERESIEFELADEQSRIYTCNFLAKVPVMSRLQAMKEIFDSLETRDSFSETDYQRLYYDRFSKSAILDGGIWNTKLGFDPSLILNASYMSHDAAKIGYRPTRTATMEKLGTFEVERIV